jgi:Rrf2 family protein
MASPEMRVSQRLDYSLRLLIALAARPAGTFVGAGELADSLGMPRRFVELQATALAKSDLITCRRGTGGGCTLARPAASVTLADIVEAVEGSLLDVPRNSDSASSEAWATAAAALTLQFSEITLFDLAVRQREIDADRNPMYFI